MGTLQIIGGAGNRRVEKPRCIGGAGEWSPGDAGIEVYDEIRLSRHNATRLGTRYVVRHSQYGAWIVGVEVEFNASTSPDNTFLLLVLYAPDGTGANGDGLTEVGRVNTACPLPPHIHEYRGALGSYIWRSKPNPAIKPPTIESVNVPTPTPCGLIEWHAEEYCAKQAKREQDGYIATLKERRDDRKDTRIGPNQRDASPHRGSDVWIPEIAFELGTLKDSQKACRAHARELRKRGVDAKASTKHLGGLSAASLLLVPCDLSDQQWDIYREYLAAHGLRNNMALYAMSWPR